MHTIFVNGRFLFRPQTGVDRYALNVLSAIDQLLDQGEADNLNFVLIVPKSASKPFWLPNNMQVLRAGFFHGQLWEQFSLPWLTRNGLLLNLCNTAPLLKRNQIATIHDATVARYGRSFKISFRIWYNTLLPLVSFMARAVVTVSHFSESEIHRCYRTPRRKISVIYNGADHVTRLAPDRSVISRLGLRGRCYVLGVATHAAHKNVQALYALPSHLRGEPVSVVLVGGGNDRIFARTQDGHGAESGLIRTGYLRDEELVALYAEATCFVFPSFYEGFGIPPVEAMTMGCPVIAANTSAMPEVLGDAAIYFDPYDVDELAASVNRVLHDEQLRDTMIEKGREQAKRYRWRDGGRMFLALCARFAK